LFAPLSYKRAFLSEEGVARLGGESSNTLFEVFEEWSGDLRLLEC
jgi:hypothetical protein